MIALLLGAAVTRFETRAFHNAIISRQERVPERFCEEEFSVGPYENPICLRHGHPQQWLCLALHSTPYRGLMQIVFRVLLGNLTPFPPSVSPAC